jgi:mannose-1-phosphate guanylyltransferase
VIVEPRNCGTAIGMLHGVLRILEHDPLAQVVFLPADHYVRDEALLADAVRAATTLITRDYDGLTVVGIEPDDADPELGYIVPGELVEESTRRVSQFVEKPIVSVARDPIAHGAVWNSLIFAARATTLFGLIRSCAPKIVGDLMDAVSRDRLGGAGTSALQDLYEHLPILDFSRTVLQGAESALRAQRRTRVRMDGSWSAAEGGAGTSAYPACPRLRTARARPAGTRLR